VIAVIFEVVPAAGCKQKYLDLASALKEELSHIDGFLAVERLQSG
jgi:heme-degrading monooxygenase HmoA